MKFSNTKALTTRLLVALALAAASVAGISGIAEAATCFTCHAPVGSTTDIRPVESTWRNITTGSIKGSHAKHMKTAVTVASACTPCHGAAVVSTSHRNGLIDVPGLTYSKGNSFAQSGNPTGFGTCSTTCHSPTTAAITTPTWNTTATCISCHITVQPVTGTHTKHLALSGAVCGTCHAGTVQGSVGGTNHLDGNIDVIQGYPVNVTIHASGVYTGTCNTACHSATSASVVTPSWGSTGTTCTTCHTTAQPTTGSHPKHLGLATVACANCHAGTVQGSVGGTNHGNSVIDVLQGYPASVAKHAAGSYTGTCTTVCHSTSTTSVVTPTWGVAAVCTTCHTTVQPVSGTHTKHLALAGTVCGTCHAGTVQGSVGGTAHGDGNIDVLNGYPVNVAKHATGTFTGTCSTACHSATTTSVTTPTWGTTGTTCTTCHATAQPTTGSHTHHLSLVNVVCASCHAGTVQGSVAGTNHGNGVVDVLNGYPASVTKHAAGSYTGTCSTACHSTSTTSVATPTWGVIATCTFCHTTVQPTTGSHTKHLALAGAACATCHTGVVQGSVSGTGTTHGDGNIDVIQEYPVNVAKHAAGVYTGTCNTTCHSTSTASIVTPTWGSTGTTCVSCHTTVQPTTGTHTKHLALSGAVCATCHAGTIQGSVGGTNHGDGNIDVLNGYPVNVAKHAVGSYTGTCSTTCHSTTTTSATTPTWGTTGATCVTCHTTVQPTTGTHTKHLAMSGTVCATCHAGTVQGSVAGTNHGDGNIDVINGYPVNVAKHVAGTYSGTCTTVCHSTTPVSAVSPTWGRTGTTCVTCHTTVQPTTGSHTLHLAASAGANCASCHTGTVQGSVAGSAHGDGNIDVLNGYPLNVPKHTAGTYTGTCSTTICHGNVTTPTWGTSSGLVVCFKCHGYRNGASWKSLAGVTATTDSKVGAHFNHISSAGTNKMRASLSCLECHSGSISLTTDSPSAAGHNNSAPPAEVTFSTLANTKSTTPTYASATGVCSNVYCHGAGMDSNVSNPPSSRIASPTWNVSFITGAASTVGDGATTPGAGDCAKCHGYPPMTSTHAGKVATDCKSCHAHVNATGNGFDDPTLHINGVQNVTGGDCTGCHKSSQGGRVAVMAQFTSVKNSHHYQGTQKIDKTVCYACHWESDAAGATTAYHRATTGAGYHKVQLVVWGTSTTRPTSYVAANYVLYSSGNATASARSELAKINTHCTGCHNDTNKTTTPFATDSGTPSKYSWEAKPTSAGGFGAAQSISSKYLATTTTVWGKYAGNYTNSKSTIPKALSGHGNASANQRGWSTLAETLQGTAVVANYANTSGTINVLCFDCHNSHGSSASGAVANAVTSSYSSATGRGKGAILKQTVAGKGGYAAAYSPYSGGNASNNNAHKAGSALCFDCHNNAAAGVVVNPGSTTPWGYTTFGGTQAIYGYNDTPEFGAGTFAKTITYPYTALTSTIQGRAMGTNAGGHFGKSSALNNPPDAAHQIGGLCTPCHDPHGVSTAISTPANAVPMLKGTFVTSPYKTDVAGPMIARGGGSRQAAFSAGAVAGFHIDQNTLQAGTAGKPAASATKWAFGTTAKTLQTMNSTQFAGLCMNCHSQSTLNNTAAVSTGNWKTSARIHNSVAGWAMTSGTGGNLSNKVHAYTCSKCHTTHNSRLPRLLITNCLDTKHRGQVLSVAGAPSTISPATSSSGGAGRFPGSGGGPTNYGTATNPGPWYFGTSSGTSSAAPSTITKCHDTATAGGTTFDATSQQWNTKSLW